MHRGGHIRARDIIEAEVLRHVPLGHRIERLLGRHLPLLDLGPETDFLELSLGGTINTVELIIFVVQ